MRIQIRRGRSNEAEKPFWISFSDLMTAMMVLFLVVMSVALLAIAKDVTRSIDAEEERRREIEQILRELKLATKDHPNVRIDERRYSVEFGTIGNFDFKADRLPPESGAALRLFVLRELLPIARSPAAERWLNRIIIEGYTDKVGTYLGNLDLSLRRSQRVLCLLLAQDAVPPLTAEDERLIRGRFLVGGYSASLATDDARASRKVELRLEFRGVRETVQSPPDLSRMPSGSCVI